MNQVLAQHVCQDVAGIIKDYLYPWRTRKNPPKYRHIIYPLMRAINNKLRMLEELTKRDSGYSHFARNFNDHDRLLLEIQKESINTHDSTIHVAFVILDVFRLDIGKDYIYSDSESETEEDE